MTVPTWLPRARGCGAAQRIRMPNRSRDRSWPTRHEDAHRWCAPPPVCLSTGAQPVASSGSGETPNLAASGTKSRNRPSRLGSSVVVKTLTPGDRLATRPLSRASPPKRRRLESSPSRTWPSALPVRRRTASCSQREIGRLAHDPPPGCRSVRCGLPLDEDAGSPRRPACGSPGREVSPTARRTTLGPPPSVPSSGRLLIWSRAAFSFFSQQAHGHLPGGLSVRPL
jgi:hypothetical protein